MPQKSLDRREQMAKRAGTTENLKDTDLAGSEPLSGHAAKKSRHLAAEIAPPDRSASRREAPGDGQASVTRRDASESEDHFRSEAGEGTKPGHHRKEDR
jgi:hypothetical protein